MPAKKKTAKKSAAKKTAAKKKAPVAKKKAAKKAAAKKKTTTKKSSAKKKTTVSKKKTAQKQVTKQKKAAVKKVTKKSPPKASKKATKKTAPKGTKPAPYQEKKGEEYMNPIQVEHFRMLLLSWKRDLMEEVDRTVHHMQDEASNFPDPNDRATQEEEFALELRTRDRERKLIKKIDESLATLDSGDYGYCEVCGVEIGVKRLEARPTATLCIDCKTLDEIKERQLG